MYLPCKKKVSTPLFNFKNITYSAFTFQKEGFQIPAFESTSTELSNHLRLRTVLFKKSFSLPSVYINIESTTLLIEKYPKKKLNKLSLTYQIIPKPEAWGSRRLVYIEAFDKEVVSKIVCLLFLKNFQ